MSDAVQLYALDVQQWMHLQNSAQLSSAKIAALKRIASSIWMACEARSTYADALKVTCQQCALVCTEVLARLVICILQSNRHRLLEEMHPCCKKTMNVARTELG